MKNELRRVHAVKMAVAVALCTPLASAAAEVQFALDAGVGRSDNILRKPTAQQNDTITEVGTQFSVQHQGRQFAADLRGDLEYLNYQNDTFKSEVVGNAGAAFRLGLIEDRLSWSLEDVFGQTRRNPFEIVTPLNRENVNYLSTGPNLVVHLGGLDRITASARYGRVDYQTDLYNTERYSGQAGYEHDLSSVSHVGVNVGHERVDPASQAAALPAYNRQEAYARYSLEGTRTRASAEIGGSRVDRSGLADDGLLVRLTWSRKIDDISTVSLRAGRQITDAGGSLGWSGGTALPKAGLGTQSLANTLNPYTSTYVDFGWLLTGRRTNISFGGSLYDERYAATPQLDRKRYSATVRADRALKPRLTARVGFAYNRYDYANDMLGNDDKTFDLGLNWRVGRNMSLEMSAQKTNYTSKLLTAGVEETRIWLKAKYTK